MPDDRSLHYADQAFITLSRLMSNNKKDMLEHMNRAHKGELFVLQFLAKSKTEALPSELSSALHASTARISALLGSLEKKGQIRRDIDTRNRRNILVTITDAGRKRVKVEMLNMKASMTQVFIDIYRLTRVRGQGEIPKDALNIAKVFDNDFPASKSWL